MFYISSLLKHLQEHATFILGGVIPVLSVGAYITITH